MLTCWRGSRLRPCEAWPVWTPRPCLSAAWGRAAAYATDVVTAARGLGDVLKGKGLTRQVTIPVSAGLLADTDGYFASLGEYRNGDPALFVQQMAEAAFSAISNGRRLVAELHEVREGWNGKVRARRGAAAWRLADLLLRQPVVDSNLVASEWDSPVRTAERAIDTLVDAGVLTKVAGNHRDRKWAANEVLAVLDAFAEPAGRRN